MKVVARGGFTRGFIFTEAPEGKKLTKRDTTRVVRVHTGPFQPHEIDPNGDVLVAVGDPISGFTLYGPFACEADAVDAASKLEDRGWWTTTITVLRSEP